MGVDSRRPLLPAPTDSTFHEHTGGSPSATGTDLATDVSRRTDRTSYSIPDDGSPITISTRKQRNRQRERERERKRERGRDQELSRLGHPSQTSLLIEYFEAGKRVSGVHSRPSVRVRVTPSSSRKRKDKEKDRGDGDHIQISESGSGRKPTYTRRISLGTPTRQPRHEDEEDDDDDDDDDNRSVSSIASAPEDMGASRRHPLDIEFVKPDTSDVSSRYIQPTSDISTIPPDSMLDSAVSKRRPSHHNISDDDDERSLDDNLLKTPARTRSRSLSREKIAQKAAEKVASHRTRSKHRTSDKSRTETTRPSSRRRSGRHHREKEFASPESSLLSNSALSSQLKGGDQYSFRSNTSKSSLNNPRLLETVEDAIRRLILPELKELKKDQKVQANRNKFERDSQVGSAAPKDDLSRRLSKHSSAPDVTRHRRTSSEDTLRLDTSSPVAKNKEKNRTPSVISGRRPSATEDDEGSLHRKKSKGLRHAEQARIVGARLTAAALKHHDSHSTLDLSEQPRRSSKGQSVRSRSGSINETELVFQKHAVPPMPFRSEVETELTRDSILSQQTDTTDDPIHREVPRASLQQLADNASRDSPSLKDRDAHLDDYDYDDHYDENEAYDDNGHSPYLETARIGYGRGRALSPIQSVASERDEDREAAASRQTQTPSGRKTADENDRSLSIESLSSAPSTDLARSTRALTVSTKDHDPSTDRHEESGVEYGYGPSPRQANQRWEEDYHEDSDISQRSPGHKSDSRPHSRHMATHSDGSYDDRDGHDFSGGVAGNAKYIDSPLGVESDVASLMDPSVVNSAHSANNSLSNSHERFSPRGSREMHSNSPKLPGSPLKQVQDVSNGEDYYPRRMGVASPPQSVGNSSDDLHDTPRMGATGLPGAGSPIPEIGHIMDSESEINTNPSIIQGPIGGVSDENRDHWPYAPTPSNDKGTALHSPYDELAQRGAGADMGVLDQPYHTPQYEEDYGAMDNVTASPGAAAYDRYDMATPVKDEGYISGANHRSASLTPELTGKGREVLNMLESPLDDDMYDEPGHKRYLSGYSQGMSSPLYDSATGNGIDRIQSKDIVALMDHLTVRDAQRNARDTEMLITLVHSATEMRTSFEDMKKFIAQQDELLMETNKQGHDVTQKTVGGPRPYPGRTSRQAPVGAEDDGAKRKSIFKRALKGLTSKSTNDLTNIEDMLVHLLSEVETLRALQTGQTFDGNDNGLPASLPVQGQVMEKPRGLATASPRRSMDVSGPTSGRRISPVMEGDEDQEPLTPQEQHVINQQMANDAHLLGRHKRGGSMPVNSRERTPVAAGALSNDTTPKTSNEKTRKHKSSNSSFFPKISRWSKTTASSMGDNLRNTMQTGRKERPSSEMSRSGSDLEQRMYATGEYYDPEGDDRLRSEASVARDKDDRPPSPLVPSQVSEHPRYKAHRDSLNLQHPQPRPGAPYQNHLENQAQNFGPYSSPKSEAWASNPTLNAAHPDRIARQQSPMSDGGYSFASSRSGRKVRDDGPLIPRKPAPGQQASYAERMATREEGPRPGTSAGSSTGPQRRLTGPRPYTSSGKYAHNQAGYAKKQNQNQNRSPVQVDDDDDDDY